MLFGGDHGCERLKTTFRWNTIYFRICNLSNYNQPFSSIIIISKMIANSTKQSKSLVPAANRVFSTQLSMAKEETKHRTILALYDL
jgi:hypothetical protein